MKIEDFSSRLKTAMKTRGVKAVDIAEKTGWGKSKISQYINGVYQPKPDALFTLAELLGVDEGWLMGYDCQMDKPVNLDPSKSMSREEQILEAVQTVFGSQASAVLAGYSQMNVDGKAKLTAYMKDLLENPRNIMQDGKKLLNA